MHFVVDVEADGPCPSLFSMVSFAAVAVPKSLDPKDIDIKHSFFAELKPLPDASYQEAALKACNLTRSQTLGFAEPAKVMQDFEKWLGGFGEDRLTFWSDNNGFDWSFVNWYFHRFCERNPFGFSSRRIGDLYAGASRNVSAASRWKSLRQTEHTHHPLDDAKGNVEAMCLFMRRSNLRLP